MEIAKYAASVGCMESQKMYLEASGHVGIPTMHRGPNSNKPVPQHPWKVCWKPSLFQKQKRKKKKKISQLTILE